MAVTPSVHTPGVDPLTSPDFAWVARRLAGVAASAGLRAPAFASPPRLANAQRTIRWLAPGRALVSVRRDRQAAAVVDDMVEGVLVANHVPATDAAALRSRLREAVVLASK